MWPHDAQLTAGMLKRTRGAQEAKWECCTAEQTTHSQLERSRIELDVCYPYCAAEEGRDIEENPILSQLHKACRSRDTF